MSQSATSNDDRLVYAVLGRDATAYHTDPACQFLRQGWRDIRRVPLSTLHGRELCSFCDGFKHTSKNWQNGQCRHCGNHIGGSECAFCEVFDRVHDVAEDARYCPLDQPGGVVDG